MAAALGGIAVGMLLLGHDRKPGNGESGKAMGHTRT
jgi:hypothetical protein